ncbi:hypothetical protein AN218_01790 [Streptomyces nanshensis]|uniref:Uncharacterized protein n=1 Tax=Streptomyces nanshensis TaxID=518642 RepID=A0A1E7LCA0_9ACTN|nr:hypothetical protein AN218_01790 [Streptomyces nanshensis]
MPTVIRRTPEQLREQRCGLLAAVGMDWENLQERAESYSLSPAELEVWHTIRGIDYLLTGEVPMP